MADLVFDGIGWAYAPPPPAATTGDGSVRVDAVDLRAATILVASHFGFVVDVAAGWELLDVTAQLALVEPGDELDLGGARFAVTAAPVDAQAVTFPVAWAGGLANLNAAVHVIRATRGPGPPEGVAWATLAELKVVLGLADTDTSSDELLELELAAVNAWAFTQRAQTGRYPDDTPTVPPSDAVTLGVLNYTVRQLRDRGFAAARAAGGAEGYDVPTMASVMSLLGLGGSVVVA